MKVYAEMGKESPEGSALFKNNSISVICTHELFRRMDIYELEERDFKKF